jgi:glycosyltransferase involved in cell wall biosynthesis
MKVSVCITTYNHGKYIAQAIDSVLMQRTNFDYEIIIGEDDSTDNTRAIVKEYKNRYPDKIRLFLNDRKNVIYINGKPTGRMNLANNLRHASGEYIALLDGDDYWSDPFKLQKQVDLLDRDPACSMCYHNVMVCYEDEPDRSHPFYDANPKRRNTHPIPQPISTLEDLLAGNYIHTPSVMFRRCSIHRNLPDWFFTLDRGDWPLHILNSHEGHICYINEVMACYRVHQGGVFSTKSFFEKSMGEIQIACVVDKHFDYRYNDILSLTKAHRLYEIIKRMPTRGKTKQVILLFGKYVKRVGFCRFDLKAMILLLERYFPRVFGVCLKILRIQNQC